MSRYPMQSPPKKPFPLLNFSNASSKSFSPANSCSTASAFASSVCALANPKSDGNHCAQSTINFALMKDETDEVKAEAIKQFCAAMKLLEGAFEALSKKAKAFLEETISGTSTSPSGASCHG
ncbi:hypothetical protein Cni_G27150 [Canna indica]|uniref:Uncharacterized protein n=1 Tax=Canna indica TaxID=4628 RepID=A0AAQ3L506_9LILI|nr:hypothetical protein Cni_G27150 [Canna indica]